MPTLPPNFGTTQREPRVQATPLPRAQTGATVGTPLPGVNSPQLAEGAQGPSAQPSEQELGMLQQLFMPAPPGASVDIGGGMVFGPPANEAEKEQRKMGFKALFEQLSQSPEAQQALLAAAVQVLKPIDPATGETVINRIAQGGLVGASTFSSLSAEGRQEEREEEKLDLERERVQLSRENLELSKATTEEQLELSRERLGISKAELDLRVEQLGFDRTKASFDIKKKALEIEALMRSSEVEEGKRALNQAFFEAVVNDPTLPLSEAQQRQLEALIEEDFEAASEFVSTLRGEGAAGDQRDRKIESRYIALKYLAQKSGIDVSDPELMRRAEGITDESIVTIATEQGITLVDTEKALLGMEGATQTLVPGGGQAEAGRAEPPLSETAVAAAEIGTGLLSGILAVTASAPFREGITDTEAEAVQSRTRLKNLNNDLIEALRLNNRAQKEIERIQTQLSPLEPGIWRPTATSRAQQKSVDTFLKNEIEKLRRDLNDPSLSSKQREDKAGQLAAFENARDSLGVRQFEAILDQLKNNPTAVSGQLTPEDAMVILNILPDDEIRKLPDDAKLILDRLTSG